MNLSSVFKGPERNWNIAFLVFAAAALLLNYAALVSWGTILLFPLLYIPVVIGSYRYPKLGLAISVVIGAVFFLMVPVVLGGTSPVLPDALVRACVLVIIGGLIAVLSSRLREQENLYRGLFDHSEAGSVLVREEEGKRVIEDLNWNAATLVGNAIADLKGKPLGVFMGEDNEQKLFAQLARDGKVYAEEVLFSGSPTGPRHVLTSVAAIPGNRAVITFVDITSRVNAENALNAANRKLGLLSRISAEHLHRSLDEIMETVGWAISACEQPRIVTFLRKVEEQAWDLARQMFVAETFQDLGASPPAWIPVQAGLYSAAASHAGEDVSFHFWTERLEVYADPLFREVLVHLVDNSIRHGGSVHNVSASYYREGETLALVIEDDGPGIPGEKKEAIFEYDSGHHAGLGLFICRQILEVTGIRISENGQEGNGARFVMQVPAGNWRVEGTGDDAPAFSHAVPSSRSGENDPLVRELVSSEFGLADTVWVDYHETKGDPTIDRIFATFMGGNAVSLARCRRHPDGLEVDAVFTPVSQRGHGFAQHTVHALVEACGHETLYMHSVLNLTDFYRRYGFEAIDEHELPPTIKERFSWANGEMEGANVRPMRRNPVS